MFWEQIVSICIHEFLDTIKNLPVLLRCESVEAFIVLLGVPEDPLFVGNIQEMDDELYSSST